MKREEREQYYKIAEWERKEKSGQYTLNRKILVKDDGRNSPAEDFANNVEAYFSQENENFLKNKNPNIYKWMRNYFK